MFVIAVLKYKLLLLSKFEAQTKQWKTRSLCVH